MFSHMKDAMNNYVIGSQFGNVLLNSTKNFDVMYCDMPKYIGMLNFFFYNVVSKGMYMLNFSIKMSQMCSLYPHKLVTGACCNAPFETR